jgi:hypothetical protein
MREVIHHIVSASRAKDIPEWLRCPEVCSSEKVSAENRSAPLLTLGRNCQAAGDARSQLFLPRSLPCPFMQPFGLIGNEKRTLSNRLFRI